MTLKDRAAETWDEITDNCHRSEPDGERGWQSLLHARILDTHLEFLCARLFVSYVPADMISRNISCPLCVRAIF